MKSRMYFNQFNQIRMRQKVNSLKNQRFSNVFNQDQKRQKINSVKSQAFSYQDKQVKKRQILLSIKTRLNQTQKPKPKGKESKFKLYYGRLVSKKIRKQIVADLGIGLVLLSLLYIGIFGYIKISHDNAQRETMELAEKLVGAENLTDTTNGTDPSNPTGGNSPSTNPENQNGSKVTVKANVIGTLTIPKLKRTLPIVEGTDAQALMQGVGHMSVTALPGQGEQIIFSGHNDTVFRKFDKMKIGDIFEVTMPNGVFKYKIKSTKIVSKDDTSVVGKMGQEVLVVTTCYPFRVIGEAPQRFVIYAYPVGK